MFCYYIKHGLVHLPPAQWFLVFKIWRKAFTNPDIVEVYKKTIRMYCMSNEEELKIAPVRMGGSSPRQGRNRVPEHLYRSNEYDLLRAMFTIIVVGITTSAITIGNWVFSGMMLGAVALVWQMYGFLNKLLCIISSFLVYI